VNWFPRHLSPPRRPYFAKAVHENLMPAESFNCARHFFFGDAASHPFRCRSAQAVVNAPSQKRSPLGGVELVLQPQRTIISNLDSPLAPMLSRSRSIRLFCRTTNIQTAREIIRVTRSVVGWVKWRNDQIPGAGQENPCVVQRWRQGFAT